MTKLIISKHWSYFRLKHRQRRSETLIKLIEDSLHYTLLEFSSLPFFQFSSSHLPLGFALFLTVSSFVFASITFNSLYFSWTSNPGVTFQSLFFIYSYIHSHNIDKLWLQERRRKDKFLINFLITSLKHDINYFKFDISGFSTPSASIISLSEREPCWLE